MEKMEENHAVSAKESNLTNPTSPAKVANMSRGEQDSTLDCLDKDGHAIRPAPQGDSNTAGLNSEESEQARLDRLGRERPAKFKSFASELAFSYSIIASQFMAVSLPLPQVCSKHTYS